MGEFAIYTHAIMVLKEEADLAAEALNLAPLISNGVGGVKAEIILLVVAEVHREKWLSIELCEVCAKASSLCTILNIKWLYRVLFIRVENTARAALYSDVVIYFVRCKEVDCFKAFVFTLP